MAKRQFQLTNEEIRELKLAYEQCRDGPTRTRLQAVRLYGSGYAVADVMEITGCSRRSLLRWCQRYRQEGIEGLLDHREGGNRAMLSEEQIAEVQRRLQQYRPIDVLGPERVATANGLHWTVPDLKQALEQWYGVVYQGSNSYRQLFQRCGFSYQRVARVFRSRSAAHVAEFAEELEKN